MGIREASKVIWNRLAFAKQIIRNFRGRRDRVCGNLRVLTVYVCTAANVALRIYLVD